MLAFLAGALTNVFTSGWSAPVGVGLAVLLVAWIGWEIRQAGGGAPSGSELVALSGDWWASWQTFKDGEEVITLQEVRFRQQGELINVETTTRGISIEDGGYHWRGELRLWDNEILMGWYAALDDGVRSKGTMYFVLHPHGRRMSGRWVGLSYDGKIVTGWGSMGREESEAVSSLAVLRQQEGQP
jgi:hypothetical protein